MTGGWHDLDKLAGLVVLVSAWLGLWRGATRIVFGLATLFAAVALSAAYGGRVGASVASDGSPLGPLVGAAIVYVAVLVVGGLIARVARGAVESTRCGGLVDRTLGLVLGAGRGVAYVAIAIVALRAAPVDGLDGLTDSTISLDVTRSAFTFVEAWLPTDTAAWVGDALLPRPAAG